jgi:hypothetical protein
MEIAEAIMKLESFRRLQKNWDSYDGLPISNYAIDRAKLLLEGLFVCPRNDGSVIISLGDEEVTIIVDDQGDVLLQL